MLRNLTRSPDILQIIIYATPGAITLNKSRGDARVMGKDPAKDETVQIGQHVLGFVAKSRCLGSDFFPCRQPGPSCANIFSLYHRSLVTSVVSILELGTPHVMEI